MINLLVRLIKRVFLQIQIAAVLISCNSYPDKVEYALDKSGNNRHELEMAIEHYQTQGDSLKLCALYYLISQLPNYLTLNYRLVGSKGEEIRLERWNYKNPEEAQADLLANGLSFQFVNATTDIKTISKEYLISNIDLSFDVWRNYPWCRDLTFDSFCEQILPHKINGERLDNWRSYFYNKHRKELDSLKAINAKREQVAFWLNRHYQKRWIKSASLIPNSYLSYEDIEQIGGGSCDHLAKNSVMLMRACGVPLNVDVIPFHGRINGGHAYNSLYSAKNEFIFFSPYDRDPERREWRAPRVFRNVFEFQESSLFNLVAHEDLPPGPLANPFFMDVTGDYFPTKDISVPVSREEGNVFLSTYNQGRLQAIIWGTAKSGVANFTNVTKELLYFPVYYEDKTFTPAASPFVLRQDGRIEQIDGNSNVLKETFTISLLAANKNITRANQPYSLFYWDGEKWQFLLEKVATNEGLLTVSELEETGLYLLIGSERLERIQRPFTCFNGKIEYW